MRKYHRILSVLLTAALTAGLLAGCGGGAGTGQYTKAGEENADASGGGSQSGGGSAGEGQNGSGSAGSGQTGDSGGSSASGLFGGSGQASAVDGEIPLGRYVEEEFTLPDSVSQYTYTTLLKGEGGRLELYMCDYDSHESVRYLYDGESWKLDQDWMKWYRDKVASGEICAEPYKITYGLDGKYYFTAVSDEEYVCHLYQTDSSGVTELLSDAFLPPAGKEFGLIPGQIDVAADGRILLHGMDYVYCYRPDGAMLFSMERFPAVSDSSVGYIDGNEFLTVTEDGVTRYDLSDGRKIEDIPFDDSIGITEYGEGNYLFGDGEGGVYLASEKGLFHVNKGGTLWEQVMDGRLNSLGRQSRYLSAFCAGADNDFYGCYTNGGLAGFVVCHYTYDPEMPSVPRYTLTVYSLTDNATVRQAASVFQEENPDVFVDVRCATETDTNVSTISDDTIRALNTEILNGKGADVFVLDGLPADSYKAKGVLMDMRELFDQIQQETPLLAQVTESYTEADGAIYQMPARIQVPFALGNADAVEAWKTLEGIRDYRGDKPLQWTDTYESILRELAVLHYPELFGADGLSLDHGTLITYLEAAKALAEASGSKETFTEQEQEDHHASNRVMPLGIKGNAIFFDAGLAASGIEKMENISDFGYPVTFMTNHPDAVADLVNGIYFPSGLIGINQATANPDLAKAFVKCIFSVDVQKENLYDGFPVSAAGLDAMFAVEGNGISFGMGFSNWDYNASAVYPNAEMRAKLRELVEGVRQPVNVNQTLLGMVVSGSMDCLGGKISVEQAASAVEQQVMLYQAERE